MPTAPLPILAGAAPRQDGSPEGVNLSQLIDWARCRYRWHLSNRRLIRRRAVHAPIDLGSAGHRCMAEAIRMYWALGCPGHLSKADKRRIQAAMRSGVIAFTEEWIGDHGAPTTDEAKQEWATLMDTAQRLALGALIELDLTRWKIVEWHQGPLIEQKLSIPFLKGVPFYGTEDVVWKDRSEGGTWVADWKFRQAMQPVEQEEVDLQLPAYQYMLARLGIATTGSIKFQIKAELPKQPTLNKDGSMSKARIATTWPVYVRALQDAGLDVNDYREMQQKLDVPFYRLDKLYRNDFYVNRIWDDVITPLGKLWKKSRSYFRTMHAMNCRGCWAWDFCLGELKGEDMQFLLDTQYIDGHNPTPAMVLKPEDFDFEP